MAENLYLQRGLKKDKGSYKKSLLVIALLFILGVIVAPLLWVNRKPIKPPQIQMSQKASSALSANSVVVGTIPKVVSTTVASNLESSKGQEDGTTTGGGKPAEKIESSEYQKKPEVPAHQETTPRSEVKASGGENPYEVRSQIQQKQAETEQKTRETTAQGATKEMTALAGATPTPPSGSRTKQPSSPASGDKNKDLLSAAAFQKDLKKPEAIPSAKTSPPGDKAKTTVKTASLPKQAPSSSPPPPSQKPEEISKEAQKEKANFWIQVGAYTKEANATKVKEVVEKLGYPVVMKESAHPKLGNLYIVRVPVTGSRTDAQKVATSISQKTGDKPFIVEAK